MNSYNTENQRILKNTIYLYVRTIVVLLVSLITARVLLNTLGVYDYGIYNVVGSVVILFVFLNNAMSQASQRFITFELGKSEQQRISDVFSMCINSQVVLMLIILFLTETLGLWLLNYKLNIPADRQFAANVVYQVSIGTFCINVIRVPFESTIVAHEHMSYFAYMSLFDSFFKLVIVYIVKYSAGDKLIEYSILLFVVTALIALAEITYVYIKFKRFRYHVFWDKDLFKNLVSFTGWSLCGGASDVVTQKGLIFLLNIYYGVLTNAAIGIANQVSGALRTFINSFQTSFRPQVIKSYANNDINRFNDLAMETSKFSYVLVLLPIVVLLVNMKLLLSVWLGNVPEYATEFCSIFVLCAAFDAISGPFYCAVLASDSIKKYQISISVVFIIDLFVTFALIKFGISPKYFLYSRLATRGVMNFLIGIYFSNRMFNFPIVQYCRKVILPSVLGTLVIAVGAIIILYMSCGWNRLIISIVYSAIVGISVIYFIILDSRERAFVNSLINKIVSK